jgi:alkylation response protein AidB-like acyl-CoA dehydrogenase
MAFKFEPLFPGMLHDAASRIAQDQPEGPSRDEQDLIAAMGWPAVLVAEQYGGVGGTVADLAAIVEGLAPRGVRLPVVERCALAPVLLRVTAADPRAERWLRSLADGAARIAPLVDTSEGLAQSPPIATESAGGYALNGVVRGVDISVEATHFLILATLASDDRQTAQPVLFIVGADSLPVPTRKYATIDGRLTADFEFQAHAIDSSDCIASGETVGQAVQEAENIALAITCVDTVATLGALIEQTAAYLSNRVQFGVALSTFQVLRHRLVDVYVRYESSRGMVAQFLREADVDCNAQRRNLQLMKLSLGETARFAAESAIQLHGGMGMSEEVLAARLAQRLLASEFRFGDRLFHSSALTVERPRAIA